MRWSHGGDTAWTLKMDSGQLSVLVNDVVAVAAADVIDVTADDVIDDADAFFT